MRRNQRIRARDLWSSGRRGLAATGLTLAVATAPTAAVEPVDESRARDAREATLQDEAPAPFEGLIFRNQFWVNLHHFLYLQAVLAERRGSLEEAPRPWMDAVELYRTTLITRDLLFDAEMRKIDERLGSVASRDGLDRIELPEGLAEVLRGAAPLYFEQFWVEHERANATWIRNVDTLLERHGAPVTARLSEVLVSQWPTAVLVDVLVYANWAGAFTSSNPDHIRIGTVYPRREAPHEAFETIFHETGHLMIDTVAERIGRAAERTGRTPPRDLWHVVLFYTVGELVRHSPATPDDYVPYAERHGLYERTSDWKIAHAALQEHWLPYLLGRVDMDSALDAILASFPAAGPESSESPGDPQQR